MIRKLGLIVTTLGLLTACAQTAAPYRSGLDPAEVKLTEAATSISHSLNRLAQVEQAANPQAKILPPPNPSSYNMGRIGSVDWSGPIEPLVARIARASGFKFKVLGVRPAIPVMITIYVRNTPLGDILRDAGFQAGSKAGIFVFPEKRIIELRYAAP